MTLEVLQHVGLPIEQALWRAVQNYPGTQRLLHHPDTLKEPPSAPDILVIGDPNLAMADTILRTHPLAKLTIVENDSRAFTRIQSLTQTIIRDRHLLSSSIAVVPGTFPHVPEAQVPCDFFDLVIAKNVIHFQPPHNQASFVSETRARLKTSGLVFATEPWPYAGRVRRRLANGHIVAAQELTLNSRNPFTRSRLFVFPSA